MHKLQVWYCLHSTITIIVMVSIHKSTGIDIENGNVRLTGWARAKLRRHPSTNTTFSMVTVITPVEKGILKTCSDGQLFQNISKITSNLTQKIQKQKINIITFKSSELQQIVSTVEEVVVVWLWMWSFSYIQLYGTDVISLAYSKF